MAMLAEPRRKQKWSVDPRNSTWSKDENKFGQKMLEKMGWSKGKGLGAQEQGSTEHVKVQMKNNTLGLGATNNHEDNWIAHQDDFNQLLEELNSHHGTGSAASSDNENKKTFSLEEKSKTSKKRVHYMKFAKGKDLSCRSDTDLACIFGKREKVKKSPKEETDSEPEEENETKSPSPPTEVEPGNTVTSSLSVNEYFAKRMAALKKSYAKSTESVFKSVEEGPEDSVEDYSEDTKKKSKKKKHKKNGDDHCPEELEVEKTLQDHVDTTDYREKRRKSKKEDKALTVENSVEEREEEEETPRKKKKKNKRKKELYEERQVEEVTSTPDEDVGTEQPKKKKKRKHERLE